MSNRLRALLLIAAIVLGLSRGADAQEKVVLNEKAFALAFSPDGKTLAVGIYDAVKLFDVDGRERSTFTVSGKVQSLSFTTDGRHLAASVFLDRTLRIWSMANGKEQSRELPRYDDGSSEDTYAAGWLADSRTLVTLGRRGSEKKEIRFVGLWEMDKGRRLPIVPVTAELPCLAVAPVGRAFAFAGREKQPTIRLYSELAKVIVSPKLLKGGHPDLVNALAFSPDGKQLASASRDMIRFWDVVTGKELSSIGRVFDGTKRSSDADRPTPQMDVFCLAFAPDGKTLVAGGTGRRTDTGWSDRIQFWDVASGKQVATLDGHADAIFVVAFAPDGKTLATSDMATVRLWDLTALPSKEADAK